MAKRQRRIFARKRRAPNESDPLKNPFISVKIDREYSEPYNGDVFVWDIDKTYLQTHFSSLRGLAAIPFERAVDKKAVPGTVPLIRAIRRGSGDISNLLPLYFVSGSPPQLRRVIEKKMTLDGVQFDGILFKDQWGLVQAGRAKDVKAQIGYKLCALLYLKLNIPGNPNFYCFGDDVESDAEVFTLFSEVLKGMDISKLEKLLIKKQVDQADIEVILNIIATETLQESIQGYKNKSPVRKIFIHLDRNTHPDRLKTDLVFPTKSFLQAALVLAKVGKIEPEAIGTVAKDLRRHNFSEKKIQKHLHDAKNRFDIPQELLNLVKI